MVADSGTGFPAVAGYNTRSYWVQTRAHWDSGGPEALVQLACALHSNGHNVSIYPTKIAPHFKSEYPCISLLPQRSVELARAGDVVIGPNDHPCPAGSDARLFVWLLSNLSPPQRSPPCIPLAHNMWLARRHGAPLIRPYITPSVAAYCATVLRLRRHSRDLILLDSDVPPHVARSVAKRFPNTSLLVSGFSRGAVRALLPRAAHVVDWSFVGSERLPIEAVLCGANLITSSDRRNCALESDFGPLPRSSIVDSVPALLSALSAPLPPLRALAPMRAAFGGDALNASTLYADLQIAGVV